MRLRQLVLACGLTSFVLSPHASALGLGEVKLKSTLNQPLEAEVKLLDTRDLTAEQVLVALASPADFERNGVDRLYFYTEFQFRVDFAAADGPKVIITSRNPVREPYLNFLIEARWTAGRLLREYTLLMDLPAFDEGSAPRSAPAAATSTPVQQPRTTTAATKATDSFYTAGSRQTAPVTARALSGSEYEVRNNDTLWEIAQRARPDSSVSVHQSMMALYRSNPDAFINGNINRLRRGQVLRIPDASEMTSLGKSEAVSQFVQTSGDTAQGAQLNASRRTNTARAESAEVSGRVKLAAPATNSQGSGQGSGANDGAGKALESELAGTLEELDKSRAENTELSSRVKDLESQIQTMERLVAVSNEKLRALQVASGQQAAAQQATTQPVTEPAITPAAPPVPVAESVSAAAPVTSAAAASSLAAAAPPAVAPATPKKVASQPAPEPTLADTAAENAPWIGLGLLGLLGLGYFAYRRRKQAEEELEDESNDLFAMDDAVAPDDQATGDFNHFNEIDEASLFDEHTETTVAETGDVVGEADIYIAYGKLDQAEEMLVNALQKDPNSTDIRMKLLEVYSQQQNTPAFDKHYAALMPLAGGALLARASVLRGGISGAGEFDPTETPDEGRADTGVDQFALEDFNLDDVADTVAPAPNDDEISNFDFDLDLEDDETDLAANSINAAPERTNEFALDFGDEPEADDLSELSLALDDLDAETFSRDLEIKTSQIDNEISFDIDELESSNSAQDGASGLLAVELESLDVAADDFNLDMNVDDVDLAALDHEMESLDVNFDDELLAEEDSAGEFELDLDGDFELAGTEYLARDLSAANLNLTDDLDDVSKIQDLELDLDDELNNFGTAELDDEQSFSRADELTLEDDDFDLAALEGDLDELSESSPVTGSEPIGTESGEDHEEDLFAQALSEFPSESDDIDLNEFSSDEAVLADLSDDDMDAELDFLADADEAATKLDLARAYIDMGDAEGAKDILSEVIGEGSDEQRKEANELLGRIG